LGRRDGSVRVGIALNSRRTTPAAGDLVQEGGCRLTRNDSIGYRVGMLFVRIPGLIDACLQVHSAALLDDVSRFVSCRAQIRRPTECDRIAEGKRIRVQCARCITRCPALMRRYVRYVVVAEEGLYAVQVGQRSARTLDALGCDLRRTATR
jgi:hypothetical protein